jgi:hypothetical protein
MITPIEAIFPIVRPIVWRTLTLAVIIAGAPSARAGGSIPGRHDLELARRRL